MAEFTDSDEVQVEVNGLMLGPGTPYLVRDFNPYAKSARASVSPRPWSAGGWSGREDVEVVAIPLRLEIDTDNAAGWLAAQQDLAAAMRASSTDVVLRWRLGGADQRMYVRPRMAAPTVQDVGVGWGPVECSLEALDPLIYADAETVVTDLGLPTFSGGLRVPHTVPFTIPGVATGGTAELTNHGKAPVGLVLRIDGPAPSPVLTLTPDGEDTQRLDLALTVGADQWLDVDTRRRSVLLNGTASRRGDMSGQWLTLPPGTSVLSWTCAAYNPDATLAVRFRSAWY